MALSTCWFLLFLVIFYLVQSEGFVNQIVFPQAFDEIIPDDKVRKRLILDLMARGGMRMGEVLKRQLRDLQDRKLILREPKNGKEYEFVFTPQKMADRLREYALQV